MLRHVCRRFASRLPLPADGLTLSDFAHMTRPATAAAATPASRPDAASAAPTELPYLSPAELKPLFGKKVFLETYGCQMNVSDTEVAWSVLQQAGCQRAEQVDQADVALVVTCAIREGAENRVWTRLEDLAAIKKRKAPQQHFQIGVLGCMAERLKEKLLERQKLVDVIAGPDAYRDLPRLLLDAGEGQTQVNVMLSRDETYAEIAPVRLTPGSPSAFVSIQRGCDNMCSYCIVPFTRGRERSRPLQTIVDEVRTLRKEGVREVTLLGQNVNSYNDLSRDLVAEGLLDQDVPDVPTPKVTTTAGFSTIYKPKIAGRGFADLLAAVAEAVPDVRIRFTSPHPKDFTDEVLQTMAAYPNICKQLHLPAQSGSSSVLARMRRGHTREAYLELVGRVRRILPGVTLSSDFIAGFCGETEEEHLDTLTLIQEVQYDMAYLFAYSMREKTHAHRRMQDDVPADVKVRRLQELISAFHEGALQRNQARIGQEYIVMVDGPSKRSSADFVGRTDGNVKIVFPACEIPSIEGGLRPVAKGDFVRVVAESCTSMTLKGRALAHTIPGWTA